MFVLAFVITLVLGSSETPVGDFEYEAGRMVEGFIWGVLSESVPI